MSWPAADMECLNILLPGYTALKSKMEGSIHAPDIHLNRIDRTPSKFGNL
jgi:hypothetical protein